MSKFYGTVSGQASTVATRRGSQDIKAAAQSWDDSSSAYGQLRFYGTFDEFKARLSGEEAQA